MLTFIDVGYLMCFSREGNFLKLQLSILLNTTQGGTVVGRLDTVIWVRFRVSWQDVDEKKKKQRSYSLLTMCIDQ